MILTQRLRLRGLSRRDTELFRALYCNRDTMHHIARPMSRAQADASLRATLAAARSADAPRFFTIAERASLRPVGLCSYRPAQWREGETELGIMLLRRECGRGLAREAMHALICMIFSRLRVDGVWVQYRCANRAMARVSDALGFAMQPPGSRASTCLRRLARPAQGDWRHNSNSRGIKMSNVIGFLEQFGGNAAMRNASRVAILRAMQRADIDARAQVALFRNHGTSLAKLLDARAVMFSRNQRTPKPAPKAPAKKPAKKAPSKKR